LSLISFEAHIDLQDTSIFIRDNVKPTLNLTLDFELGKLAGLNV